MQRGGLGGMLGDGIGSVGVATHINVPIHSRGNTEHSRPSMANKFTAALFLLLLLSAHAIEVRNKIHDGVGQGYVFLEELEKELRLDSDVVKIKGDNTDIVHLTPGDVIDIQKKLKGSIQL